VIPKSTLIITKIIIIINRNSDKTILINQALNQKQFGTLFVESFLTLKTRRKENEKIKNRRGKKKEKERKERRKKEKKEKRKS
jgi:hypothetical protein